MVKDVLLQLEGNCIANDLSLPYWIYKKEEVVVAGKKYLKIYLFNREDDSRSLESITFSLSEQDYSVSSFSVVSAYRKRNIVGAAFEIPIEADNSGLLVKREIVDGIAYFPSGQTAVYTIASKPEENEYLKEKNTNYRLHDEVYPQINDQWWQCSCGRIHSSKDSKCGCGLSKENAEEIISFDFKGNHIRDAISKETAFDLDKPFEQNYDRLANDLQSKYDISPPKYEAAVTAVI